MQALWKGRLGVDYPPYEVYSIEQAPLLAPPLPGNYIFAKGTTPGPGVAVYIGETEDMRGRLINHEKMPCAKGCGATHIHVHPNDADGARLSEEQDLIAAYNPPCNKEARRPELSEADLREFEDLRAELAAAEIRRADGEMLKCVPRVFAEEVYRGRDLYGDLEREFGLAPEVANEMANYIHGYVGRGAELARRLAAGQMEQKIRGVKAVRAMQRYGLSKSQAVELASADTADEFNERLASYKKSATDDLPPAVKKRIERLEEIARNAAPQESDLFGVSNAGGTGGGVPHDMREVSRVIREHNNRGVSAPPEYREAWIKHRKAGGYL